MRVVNLGPGRTTRALITTPGEWEVRPRSAERLAARPRPKAPRAPERCRSPAFCVDQAPRSSRLGRADAAGSDVAGRIRMSSSRDIAKRRRGGN